MFNGGMNSPISTPMVAFAHGHAGAHQVPQLGFGTYKLRGDEAYTAVRYALEIGYRHVDTAALYKNEEEVGRAIRDAEKAGDISSRADVFLTTKLWNDRQEDAVAAFDESQQKLGLDYVDCYMIHWPWPTHNTYVQAWQSLLELQQAGKVQAVAVANFNADHIERLIQETGQAPVMNQVELHPGFSQAGLREANNELGVVTEAWSPLARGENLSDGTIVRIAEEVGATPAQVVLAWHLALGLVVIPKSGHPKRIEENLAALNVTLSAEQVAQITALDTADGAGRLFVDPLQWPEPVA